MLKDRWYNVVQAESYTWNKVREIKETYELKKSWYPNTTVFMGDVLGMGQTGKVYLCRTSMRVDTSLCSRCCFMIQRLWKVLILIGACRQE